MIADVNNLEQLKSLADDHRDDFEVLGYMLELNLDVTDAQIDAWVDQVAEPIIDATDCTQCGNCCRVLDVYLTEDDGTRLQSAVDVTLDSILDYDSAQKVGEWATFRAHPCGFLKGKLCSVYDHRPESCRAYPVFTPDFRWLVDDVMDGAAICPIIFNVLMSLVQRIDEVYEL
jgi:ferredoxin